MPKHDPSQFVASLGTKLAAQSRHVCMLLGAGVGKACGLPDVKELEKSVLDELSGAHREALQRVRNRAAEQAAELEPHPNALPKGRKRSPERWRVLRAPDSNIASLPQIQLTHAARAGSPAMHAHGP